MVTITNYPTENVFVVEYSNNFNYLIKATNVTDNI